MHRDESVLKNKIEQLKEREKVVNKKLLEASKVITAAEDAYNKLDGVLCDVENARCEAEEQLNELVGGRKPCKCSFSKLKKHSRAEHPAVR